MLGLLSTGARKSTNPSLCSIKSTQLYAISKMSLVIIIILIATDRFVQLFLLQWAPLTTMNLSRGTPSIVYAKYVLKFLGETITNSVYTLAGWRGWAGKEICVSHVDSQGPHYVRMSKYR